MYLTFRARVWSFGQTLLFADVSPRVLDLPVYLKAPITKAVLGDLKEHVTKAVLGGFKTYHT